MRVRSLLRLLAYGAGALVFLFLVSTAVERVIWRERVLPGVRLVGASVSGKPAVEAGQRVQESAARLEREPLVATAGTTTLHLDPQRIALEIDDASTASAVREAGRAGNPVAQVLGTVLRWARADEVRWDISYDESALDRVLEEWAVTVAQDARDGGLEFEGATVVPVEPRSGQTLDVGPAKQAVVEALRMGHRDGLTLPVDALRPRISRQEVARAAREARDLLAAPIEVRLDTVSVRLAPEGVARTLVVSPRGSSLRLTVDTERLREVLGPEAAGLERPPRDAEFVVEGATASFIPSQDGRQLDLDRISSALVALAPPLEGEVRVLQGRLRDIRPERTTEWAQALNIHELVSTFTTNYPAGQARVQNIHRIAAIVNGHIVPPGTVLSLNETVGKRTAENGFVTAPVIYEGEFTQDVGGGVSQFATTFFNAVFFGSYEILEHQPHSVYISRYPMGREATISWPKPDVRFRNDTDTGILIRTFVTRSSVTVSFYGDKGGREVTAEGPVVVQTFGPEVEIVDDPAVPPGEERVVESGSTGHVVRVVRVVRRNGEEVKRETFTTRYRAEKRVVHRGPAPTTTTAPADTTTTAGAPPTTSGG